MKRVVAWGLSYMVEDELVELEVGGWRLEAGGWRELGAGRLYEVEAVSRSVVRRAKAYSIKANSEQSLLVGNDVRDEARGGTVTKRG